MKKFMYWLLATVILIASVACFVCLIAAANLLILDKLCYQDYVIIFLFLAAANLIFGYTAASIQKRYDA